MLELRANREALFSYIVEGLLATGLAGTRVICSDIEFVNFQAPAGQTCGAYMQEYISAAGGYLLDPGASNCQFCAIDTTDVFLSSLNIQYSNRWRDYGILWIFIVFNVFAALGLYYLARMPKKQKKEKTA